MPLTDKTLCLKKRKQTFSFFTNVCLEESETKYKKILNAFTNALWKNEEILLNS